MGAVETEMTSVMELLTSFVIASPPHAQRYLRGERDAQLYHFRAHLDHRIKRASPSVGSIDGGELRLARSVFDQTHRTFDDHDHSAIPLHLRVPDRRLEIVDGARRAGDLT